ncbi:MAG: aryl-sulfate sulfotransferase [Rhodospirillales bacterium]|nr:aryl-sulfate sulfotransferase [Rhodospirillales bacterium]
MNDGSLPPHRIETCIPERREPGMMVFNVRPGGAAEFTESSGWIIGVDQAGEVALNLKFDAPCQDTRALANGNILFSLTGAGLIKEITRTGEPVREWHVAGKWAGKSPPPASIEIDAPLTHHSINVFPNGNLLLLSAEVRVLPDWPVKDDDPDAALATANVVGDVALEVSPDGQIVNRWAMLDLLDPNRLSYGSCSNYWVPRGFADSNDWCHANAATYDAKDDSIIVSLRTQDCLVKFDRVSGELKWILGDPGNWRAPWADKLLKPDGMVQWQYHQHDVSVTKEGTILCFDNGNFRATPFGEKMPAEDSYSRAVEFAVDEAAMTVRQVWSYGDGESEGERLFACYQGGAFRLPKTSNTFLDYGGICTIDGVPTGNNQEGFTRARLIEVTPDKEIVFDMWIDASAEAKPVPLSSFRAEFVPDLP